MKKIRTLLTIPALVAILPATISLSNCSGTSDPIVDPSVSGKVSITITKNQDGSTTCKLVAKSDKQKITDVSVKIGSTTLTKGTDYSVGNDSTMTITIFKATLDKYKGSIVITPTVVDKTFNAIDSELTQSSFIINEEAFKSSHLKIYKSYEGTKGEVIPWSDEKLTIKDQDENDVKDDLTGEGITFTEKGTYSFTVWYNDQFKKTISVTASKKTYTITCSVKNECVTIDKKSIVAEEGATWGDVKPTISASRKDVNIANIDCTWQYYDGTEIQDTDTIEESFTAYLVVTFKNSKLEIFSCNTAGDPDKYDCNCYIPAKCATSPATLVDSNNTWTYTFTIDIDSCPGSFRYFWIVIKDETRERGYRLLNLNRNNLISIAHDDTAINPDVATFTEENGGTYMRFTPSQSTAFTSGTVIIKMRTLNTNTEENIIPAFQNL